MVARPNGLARATLPNAAHSVRYPSGAPTKPRSEAMPAKSWEDLSPNDKADALRREFDAFLKQERDNLNARNLQHNRVVKRLDVLEEALKKMESRVWKLERKNDV
jgi:flagellar motility protein MotE (MotC chaperone)